MDWCHDPRVRRHSSLRNKTARLGNCAGLGAGLLLLAGCAGMAHLATGTVRAGHRFDDTRALVQKASDLRAADRCTVRRLESSPLQATAPGESRELWIVDRCGSRERYVIVYRPIDEARLRGTVSAAEQ